jgi:hypothetical protein
MTLMYREVLDGGVELMRRVGSLYQQFNETLG